MLKHVPILLLLPIALCFGQAESRILKQEPSLPRAIKLVSPAVVQIAYKMDRFPPETLSALGTSHIMGAAGTGFIVNEDGYIVTALHVLSYLDPYQGGLRIRGTLYPPGRHRLLVGL